MLHIEIMQAVLERAALGEQARPDRARRTVEVIEDGGQLLAEVSNLAQQFARPLACCPSSSELCKSSAASQHTFGCYLARDRRHSVTATPSVRAGYKHNQAGVQALGGTFQRWSETGQSMVRRRASAIESAIENGRHFCDPDCTQAVPGCALGNQAAHGN